MSEAIAHIISSSNASDVGLLALSDIAKAAQGIEYRIVGGHMVHLLTYVYPTAGVTARVTSDADAGIDKLIAAGADLHDALLERGYTAQKGNRYVRSVPDHEEQIAVDIVVPKTGPDKVAELGGRGFDAVPGLSLALASQAIDVEVQAQLQDGRPLRCAVPVPDIEAALVLKALAWRSRLADKDASDVATLLEIAQAHRPASGSDWLLDDPKRTRKGQRLDAAHALYLMADRLGRGAVTVPPHPSPRLIALIHKHVCRQPTGAEQSAED